MNEDSDILVFIGDRKYKNFSEKINDALFDGRVKKIIYIGTEPFWGYDNDNRNVRYSFSYREVFTYFYGQFTEIKFHKFDFSWLFDNLRRLKQILINANIQEEYHKKILTTIASLIFISTFVED
jgi:hypothetical protein